MTKVNALDIIQVVEQCIQSEILPPKVADTFSVLPGTAGKHGDVCELTNEPSNGCKIGINWVELGKYRNAIAENTNKLSGSTKLKAMRFIEVYDQLSGSAT